MSTERPGSTFPWLALIVTAIAFGPALRAPFLGDDYHAIEYVARASLGELLTDGLWDVTGGAGRYRPTLHLSAKLDWWISGLGPLGYHVTSVLVHWCSGLLLYAILRRVASPFVAFLAPLLWLVHPLHFEPVNWFVARGNLLGGVFMLLSVLAFLRMRESASPGRRVRTWIAVLLTLLTHETVILLPVLLVVIDRLVLAGGRGRALRTFAFAVSPLVVVATLRVLTVADPFGGELTEVIADVPVAQWPRLFALGVLERAKLLLAPVHPTFGPAPWWTALVVTALAVAVALARSATTWRSGLRRVVPVALALLLLWAPTAPVIVRADTFANARTFYALTLPVAVLGAMIVGALPQVMRIGLAAVFVAGYGTLLFNTSRLWDRSADEAAEWARAASRAASADATREKILLLDPPMMRDGILILENAVGSFLKPPFHPVTRECHVMTRQMLAALAMLPEKDEFRRERAVFVARYGAQLVERTLPAAAKLATRSFTGSALEGTELTALDVAAIRATQGSTAMQLDWESASGLRGTVYGWPLMQPELGGGVLFPVGSDTEWLLAGTVVALRFEGGDPGRVSILTELPALTVTSPEDGHLVTRGDPPPAFRGELAGFGSGGRLVFVTWPGALPLQLPLDGKEIDFTPEVAPSMSGRFSWSVFEKSFLFPKQLRHLYWCIEEYDPLLRAVARSPLRRLLPRR